MIIDATATTPPRRRAPALPRRADGRAVRPVPPRPARARSATTNPRDHREQPAEDPARARQRPHALLAARLGDGASRRRPGDRASTWARSCNDLIASRDRAVPGQLRRRLPAAADARAPPRRRDRRAAPLRRRAGLRRLQPQPRPVRRALDRAAADRPVLVPAVRDAGRARRAGDGPRAPSCNPNLHSPARTTSTPTRRCSCSWSRATCSAGSRRCGWSSRTAAARCRTTGAASAGMADGLGRPEPRDHVLRNVFFDTCVYHQPGIDLLLEVIAGGQHPVRLGDDRRGARHRPRDRLRTTTTPSATSTRPDCPTSTGPRSRDQRAARVPAAGRPAGRQDLRGTG